MAETILFWEGCSVRGWEFPAVGKDGVFMFYHRG